MTDAQRQTGIEGNMKALDEIAEVATKDKQLLSNSIRHGQTGSRRNAG